MAGGHARLATGASVEIDAKRILLAGGGMMIHAPQTGDVVKISPAFRGDYAGACRP